MNNFNILKEVLHFNDISQRESVKLILYFIGNPAQKVEILTNARNSGINNLNTNLSAILGSEKSSIRKLPHGWELTHKGRQQVEKILERSEIQIKQIASSEESFWKLLHSKVIEIAKPRYQAGHYADAVEAVLKEINSLVKRDYLSKTGKEEDGSELMNKAFNTKPNDIPPRLPVISFNKLETESEKNIQLGYQHIFAGVMQAIRNPKAHENIIIDSNRCIHFLFLSSLLFQVLDDAGVANN